MLLLEGWRGEYHTRIWSRKVGEREKKLCVGGRAHVTFLLASAKMVNSSIEESWCFDLPYCRLWWLSISRATLFLEHASVKKWLNCRHIKFVAGQSEMFFIGRPTVCVLYWPLFLHCQNCVPSSFSNPDGLFDVLARNFVTVKRFSAYLFSPFPILGVVNS